ncbi:MAG: esterase-like activity of phytase family protein [Reyranellaceae bacterium]
MSILRSLLVLCLLAAACSSAAQPTVVPPERAVAIRSLAIPLKLDDPAAATVGRLRWRGGISMTADSARFGGWSDLHVAADGRSLAAISDEGAWLTATIDYDARGDLAGLSQARLGPLRDLDGRLLADKAMADAEGMARLPDGSWLVSFERDHRLWRYPGLDGKPVAFPGPADLARQPKNGGVEALTALPDGRVVAISEELSQKPSTVTGWIGTPITPGSADGGYAWASFAYATVPDFVPTAITRLPDGSFVTLERAFDMVRGVRCRVMHFAAAALQPGATVQPTELAFLASPWAVDNLEGLAATRGPNGETLLWIVSDDNFNPLQRNILLLFELLP